MLKKFRPDVLNAHYATGYGTLARRCGVRPLLSSVWGSDVYEFPYQGWLNRRIVVKNLESATAIASTSNNMANQVREIYREQKKIYITPFGVDTGVFKPCGQPPEGKLTIGIVKALEPKYGVEYLIKAFSMLKKRLEKEGSLPEKGIKLEIYGDGSQFQKLKRLARELNIEWETQFHGAVPHAYVPRILCSFDVFCAPSISDSESFGVAAVEAMSCGIPVVTSNADGFREVVRDNETGFVVTRRDPVILANKLYILARDAGLRRTMGEAGRAHVQRNYEWADCVHAMENALTETAMTKRASK